jgi:hypothetical protein
MRGARRLSLIAESQVNVETPVSAPGSWQNAASGVE